MAKVYLKYNPYKMETFITVNGNEISEDSILAKLTKGKRLQEWISKFPEELVNELNTVDLDIMFYGMKLDFDDVSDVFNKAKNSGLIKKLVLDFTEGKNDDTITDDVIKIFNDLQNAPEDIDPEQVKDFKDPKLLKAFDNINKSVFPIDVVATMSSGKSTLINALLGKKLMPAKNEACTATITEILDNDEEQFTAVVYDEDNVVLKKIDDLTLEEMNQLNDNSDVSKISAKGNIPFLDSSTTALMLVDTPGPNNSQTQAHKNTTYRAINNDANNLILYVMNGTQLRTNDDAALLSYVAEQIKKGGKQVRDRFLFVINKMDSFNPEEESISKVIEAAKQYLASYGIEDPQVYPCSAYTALNVRTYFDGVDDILNMPTRERRALPSAARDTISMVEKFVYEESMHLELYSTLSPSAQEELDKTLSDAVNNNDVNTEVLIHCGIYSIEAAIKAYVKKYAKTKKVKDLVETFREVLESTQIIANVKSKITTDEEMAKACAARAAKVKESIENGAEADAFKERIDALDPMDKIVARVEELKSEVTKQASRIFAPYGDTINSRTEAQRLVKQFTNVSSDAIAKLTTELESVINNEIVETGEQILREYSDKLTRIDSEAGGKQLDFNTEDLIKGALGNMKDSIEALDTDDFATDTVDELGETTTETKTYYEKTGQKAGEVFDGIEKVKVGTERVKTGTRTVLNPKKRWWKIFTPKWIEEDVYEDQDIYEDKKKYKTVMRDIYEERTETIEKYCVDTAIIQTGLISNLSRRRDEGIEETLNYAQEEIDNMKSQFRDMFDELDELIKQKYTELEQCMADEETRKAELEKSRRLCAWIEERSEQIEKVLDI